MARVVKDKEWGTVFPNFRKDEFDCNHHSVGDGIYYSLLEVMQQLRNEFGSISVSCGYRCPECNASVGGASNSAHLYGGACDFYIDSGFQENVNNRMALVTRLRNMGIVHYCYCKVDENRIWDGYNFVNTHCNMGAYIHVDTYPGEYKEEIDKFEIKEVGEDFVKVDFKAKDGAFDWAKYSINKQEWINLPTDNTIRKLQPDTTYRVRIELRNKGTDLWSESEELVFNTLKHQEEEKPQESTNIPETPETHENEPQKQEIEHKENIFAKIIKNLIEMIIKLLSRRK